MPNRRLLFVSVITALATQAPAVSIATATAFGGSTVSIATAFGAFLDPVADKITVTVALVVLVESYAEFWLTVPAVIIICREIVISALREWMAETGKSANVAVSYIGKVKTTMQMGSIIVLLASPPGTLMGFIGVGMLYAAAILTIWSMVLYLLAAWSQLKKAM